MMEDLIRIRPALSYAVFKIVPWLLLAMGFLALAWVLLPSLVLMSVLLTATAFFKLLQRRAVCYVLSGETLLVECGIICKRQDHLELFRVKDYVVTENLLLQALGLMTLELLTTDLTGPVVRLQGIPKSGIAEVVRRRVQAARQRNKILELN